MSTELNCTGTFLRHLRHLRRVKTSLRSQFQWRLKFTGLKPSSRTLRSWCSPGSPPCHGWGAPPPPHSSSRPVRWGDVWVRQQKWGHFPPCQNAWDPGKTKNKSSMILPLIIIFTSTKSSTVSLMGLLETSCNMGRNVSKVTLASGPFSLEWVLSANVWITGP